MKKVLCVLIVVFLNTAAVTAGGLKKTDSNLITAREVAENVLANPVQGKYQTVCAYFGVLKFAQAINDRNLVDKVKQNYAAFMEMSDANRASSGLMPIKSGHVDWNAFGILPFELYLQTKDEQYLKVAMKLAEEEWAEPNSQGLTAYTRFWVDDMFMVGALQMQAYKATGKDIFLERALTQLLAYTKVLQQENGLFQHAMNVPVFWGRGNGWAAAVMAITLESMPKEHPRRMELMNCYKNMMAALKKYQSSSGLWHQIVIDPESYQETSCTGMFTFAIATGVKNGWLDKSYSATAMRGWKGLVRKVKDGKLMDVCVGTGAGTNYNYYLNRPRKSGDLHGQAAFLWATTAIIE